MDSGSADPGSNPGRTIFKGIREQGIETWDLKNTYFLHKDSFFSWLKNNKSAKYSQDLIRSTEELFKSSNLDLQNIKVQISRTKYSDKYTIVGLRNFLNYCEEFELLSYEQINKIRNKVKLNFKSAIDSYVPTRENIKESFEKIKTVYPDLELFYKLMLESGCRFTELEYIILNFNEKNIEEFSDLEITLYRNFYLRGQKSSFYLFFTSKTFDKLKIIIQKIDKIQLNSFKNRITRDQDIVSLKYLRKYQFTLLVEQNVSFEIANFIQGRASQNVGFNNYLSKKVIAIKEFKKILNDVKWL